MRTERQGPLAFPDSNQAMAFHQALMQRLGVESPEVGDEGRLRATLDRAWRTAQQQRADLVVLAASLLFGLIRDQPFGKGSAQTGIALTFAFLLRNGFAVAAPPEEVVEVTRGVARGEMYTAVLEMWLRDSVRPLRY